VNKLSGSKLSVEVKGNMSPEGADRVGMVIMVIDRVWWKIVMSIGLAIFVFNGAYANKLVTHFPNADEPTWGETVYACLIAYHPPLN
jgi:hypothetical protein